MSVVEREGSTGRAADAPTVAIVAEDDVLVRRLRVALRTDGPSQVVTAAGFDELRTTVDVIVHAGSDAAVAARAADGAVLIEVVPSGSAREVRDALKRGARGVVAEGDIRGSLVDTIRAVLSGQLVLPVDAAALISRPALSPREKQVLGLVVIGLSNYEVAKKLHLAEATVKSHLRSSFRKLGVRTRSEASLRILDPDSGLGVGILAITPDDNGSSRP